MNILAKKWVEVLRSGRYKQGRSALNVDNKFCCLGVACDLYEPESVRSYDAPPGTAGVTYEGSSAFLPWSMVKALGLAHQNGTFKTGVFWKGDIFHSLAALNDAGATFDFIADVIESEPTGLFV